MAKILVIEDSPTAAGMLASLLEENGYEAAIAADGSQGLVQAADNPPDLVLLDIMLPDMNGKDVCLLLRENEKTKNIPVIMVTSKTDRSSEVTGLSYGAVYYIKKPFDPPELLDKIKIALETAKRE